MIRKMQNPDINRVADIWLKTNLKAHDFIPEPTLDEVREKINDVIGFTRVQFTYLI